MLDVDAPEVPHRDGRSTPAGLAAAVGVGVLVGGLTSFGQTYLDGTLNPLVNSASAWLVVPFLIGAVMRTAPAGASAGVLCCLSQVAGYYVTANLRGFPASRSFILFWTVCALVGGPVFGAAGQLWRRGPERLAAPASMVLPAAFLAEGIWVYAVDLGYVGSAVFWITVGIVLAVLLPRRWAWLRWLPVTTAIGIAGEVVLSQIHSQAF